MNRTEELMNMKGAELIAISDSYGLKVNTNKERTQLKASKKAVVELIVKHEAELERAARAAEEAAKNEQKKPRKKREVKLIEFDGRKQTLAEWSAELGISVTTLYGRIYYRNKTVEEAFTMNKRERA